MPILTIENLFTILISGILLPIGGFSYKRYKNFLNPTTDSIYFSKKSIFYEEIFSENIKSIFICHIKNYLLRMTENVESFRIFEKFIKSITKNSKNSLNTKIDDEHKEFYKKNLINHIDTSETYDSVFTELDPKEIKSWVKNFNKFSLYPKCIKRYKILTYYSFVAFGVLICSLIGFDLFLEENIVYILYLVLIALTYIILAIFYLISYYKCFNPLNKIFEQKYSQKIILKS